MKRVWALVALLTFVFVEGCARDVSWHDYRTSEYHEGITEILARVHIFYNSVEMDDCRLCFASHANFTENCAHIDGTGIVFKRATHRYSWIKELECRREKWDKPVKKIFTFPYYLAETNEPDTVHYLGDITIDLNEAKDATITVSDKRGELLREIVDLGKKRPRLKIVNSFLTKQDTLWSEEQKTKE